MSIPSPPPTTDIAEAIGRFVREVGAIPANDPGFNHNVDLFDSGYVDSLGVVALTAFIETTFGVTFTDEDLFDPRFTTVSGMAKIVTTRSPQARS